MTGNLELPKCDPVVAEGHPKCLGVMVPIEQYESAYNNRKKYWKCTVCAREVG